MAAQEESRTQAGAATGSRTNWTVLAVCEGAEGRQKAVQFCDNLVRQFWAQFDFDVTWRTLDGIEAAPLEQEAIASAMEARVIIFALSPHTLLPEGVKRWIESWLAGRGDREGILVGLNDPGGLSGDVGKKYLFLRTAAHRGGMDYLTDFPQEISWFIPDSYEAYNERADVVTHVLDDILRQQPPPPPALLR